MKIFRGAALSAALLAVAACSSGDEAPGSSAEADGSPTILDVGGSSDANSSDAGANADAGSDAADDATDPDAGGTDDADIALVDAGEPDITVEDTGPGPDTDPNPDDAGTGGDSDASEPGTGYPSNELQLVIIGPSPEEWGQSPGQIVNINGLLFGHADTITWIHEETGDSGEATVGPYWYVSGVKLQEGTNTISIIASSADEVSTDQVRVIYNPTFAFDSPPRVSPRAIFANENNSTVVTLPMTNYKNYNGATLKLNFVDANGQPMDSPAPLSMSDNGNLGNCDEVDQDGLFSACVTFNKPEAGCQYVRASVEVKAGFTFYTAWSPVTQVCAVERITAATCQAIVDTQTAARAEYETLAAEGTAEAAQQAVIDSLLQNPDVAEAGPASDGYGIWIRYTSGLLGALTLSPEGWRGGSQDDYTTVEQAIGAASDELGSKSAMILSPFASEFGDTDEGPAIASTLKNVGCPSFGVGAFTNEQASLYRFRHMSENGIVAISSHGEAYFKGLSEEARSGYDWDHAGSQEVIWTGEKVDCTRMLQSTPSCSTDGFECENGAGECVVGKSSQCVDYKQADLRRGRVIFGAGTYGIVPDFVGYHAAVQPFNKGIVYLGSCRSMFNGGFASRLFGHGVMTVVGFSDYVRSEFAHDLALDFFTKLITDALPAGEAWASEQVDSVAGGAWRMFGNPKATAKDGSIINPSFETGDKSGWKKDGDGRVIAQLGNSLPVDGKFMGLVSSGLGFTSQVGELKQKFCIDSAKSSVSFYWKYFSEEFIEFCGSGYQDPFLGTIENDVGKVTIADLNVNALCPPNECGGCGGKYVGLVPSDVSFDQGDVYNTAWQKSEANISALVGGPVTIKFFLTDAGDSIYDTVVLIDKIDFK